MTQNEIFQAMREDYGELYDAIYNLDGLKSYRLSRFFPMKGVEYDNAPIKLMIVGRSSNGWTTFDFANKSKQDFIETAINEITDTRTYPPYTGVIKYNGEVIARTRCVDRDPGEQKKDVEEFIEGLKCTNLEYCECTESARNNNAGFSSWLYPDGQSRTAIIRYKEKIDKEQRAVIELSDVSDGIDHCKVGVLRQELETTEFEYYRYTISNAKILGATRETLRKMFDLKGRVLGDKLWFENIVWTNCCPVSPPDEGNAKAGNAENELKKEQLDAAKALLKDQLDYFKPDYVIIATDIEGWFDKFAGIFEENTWYASEDKKYEINSGDKSICKKAVVRASTIYIGDGFESKIVVTIRPDRRDINQPTYQDFAQQVVDAFKIANVK